MRERKEKGNAPRQKLMSVAELAEYLGIAKATVYNWNALDFGPRRIKVGGKVRYRPSDVEAWLDSRQA